MTLADLAALQAQHQAQAAALRFGGQAGGGEMGSGGFGHHYAHHHHHQHGPSPSDPQQYGVEGMFPVMGPHGGMYFQVRMDRERDTREEERKSCRSRRSRPRSCSLALPAPLSLPLPGLVLSCPPVERRPLSYGLTIRISDTVFW